MAYFSFFCCADFEAESFDVDFLQQLLDALGAHHGGELTEEFLVELALALIGDHFAFAKLGHFAGIHDHESFKIQNAFQLAKRDVQQVTDAAGETLEKPYMRAGAGQLDMSQTLAANAR